MELITSRNNGLTSFPVQPLPINDVIQEHWNKQEIVGLDGLFHNTGKVHNLYIESKRNTQAITTYGKVYDLLFQSETTIDKLIEQHSDNIWVSFFLTIICNTINMEQYAETQQELTLNDIKEIEKEFGVDIPQDMKAHYLQNNGGFPPYNRIKADKYILSIDGFIPLKYGICNIGKLSADYQKSGLLFANMLPFANDEGGNIYLIDLDHR